MELELAKVSEKGQIVIPNSLRKGMGIKKSDQFLIFGEGDTLILKKVERPSMRKSLSEITAPLQKVIKDEGFTREDLKEVIKNIIKQKN